MSLWDAILEWAIDKDPIDNARFILQGITQDAPCLTIAWTPGARGRLKRAMRGIGYTSIYDSDTITIGVARSDLERARDALRMAGLL